MTETCDNVDCSMCAAYRDDLVTGGTVGGIPHWGSVPAMVFSSLDPPTLPTPGSPPEAGNHPAYYGGKDDPYETIQDVESECLSDDVCMCLECMTPQTGDGSGLPPAYTRDYWQSLALETIEANKTLAALVKTLTERVYRQGNLIASYASKGIWTPEKP